MRSSLAILTAITLGTEAASIPKTKTTTSYVIVGGGPAGLVLADRLSQNGRHQVTLLEAGPDTINNELLQVPAQYPLGGAGNTWNYTAAPDPNLGGLTTNLAQGWGLGGGTAVNGMAYCRGASSVFDAWAEVSGNSGLAWNSILQDFLEVSHYTETFDADYEQVVNETAYGNGEIEVSRTSGVGGFEEPFSTAVEAELGLQQADLNDGTGIGLDRGIASIYALERRRSYARNSFGVSAMGRDNVKIIPNAWVKKINFEGKTATGVEYVLDGQTQTINADEVIVSGGAINTPKLLMLSGVGPEAQLSKLGISVVLDSPEVGRNLRDHPFAVTELLVTPDITTMFQWLSNATVSTQAADQYATDRSGPLGWNNGFVYGTFRVPDEEFANVENATHYTDLPADRPHLLIEYSGVPFIPANESAITVFVALVQPEYTGSVELSSDSYTDQPLINTNYYGTDADKAAIIYGYKKLREVIEHDSIKSKTVGEVYPGFPLDSDEAIWKAIQGATFSFSHPVGSVALGKVLDERWRIKGLENIRVIDSSAFPFPTSCHPQSAVYALANRAAKDILNDDEKA
ncbi:putative glucose-methanol-choline oxidoreductase [Diaporthe sp. PMI_573]|nr:putative glucose-methanol-choline oxidoreductase [Diaporthaceae sp. PMI_573]